MDWNRAKNIIIILFALLNIFLFTYSGLYRSKSSAGRETYGKITTILEGKGVTMEQGLRVTAPIKETSMLIMENNLPDGEKIVKFFLDADIREVESKMDGDANIEIFERDKGRVLIWESGWVQYTNENTSEDERNRPRISEGFNDIFKLFGISKGDYVLDKKTVTEDTTTYCFVEKYKDYFIYDNFLVIKTDCGGIRELSFFARKVKGLSRTKNPILSPYHVLLKNYYSSEDELTVNDISFGYKEFNEVSDGIKDTTETFLSPAWRIVVNDSEEHFFKAYDGERIK